MWGKPLFTLLAAFMGFFAWKTAEKMKHPPDSQSLSRASILNCSGMYAQVIPKPFSHFC
jgi:hypothetical protein